MRNVSCEEGKKRWERVGMPISRVQFTGSGKIKRKFVTTFNLLHHIYALDFNSWSCSLLG